VVTFVVVVMVTMVVMVVMVVMVFMVVIVIIAVMVVIVVMVMMVMVIMVVMVVIVVIVMAVMVVIVVMVVVVVVVVWFVSEESVTFVLEVAHLCVLNVHAASHHKSFVPSYQTTRCTRSDGRLVRVNGCQNRRSDKSGKLCAVSLSDGDNFSP